MTEARFQRLSELVKGGVATLEEQVELLDHADKLRDVVIESINDHDRWDEDWDVLGYQAYVEGEERPVRTIKLLHRHLR